MTEYNIGDKVYFISRKGEYARGYNCNPAFIDNINTYSGTILKIKKSTICRNCLLALVSTKYTSILQPLEMAYELRNYSQFTHWVPISWLSKCSRIHNKIRRDSWKRMIKEL